MQLGGDFRFAVLDFAAVLGLDDYPRDARVGIFRVVQGDVSPPFILPTDSLLLQAVNAHVAIAMNKPARTCRVSCIVLERIAVIEVLRIIGQI